MIHWLSWKKWSERPTYGKVLAVWKDGPWGQDSFAMTVDLDGDSWSATDMLATENLPDPTVFTRITMPGEHDG